MKVGKVNSERDRLGLEEGSGEGVGHIVGCSGLLKISLKIKENVNCIQNSVSKCIRS